MILKEDIENITLFFDMLAKDPDFDAEKIKDIDLKLQADITLEFTSKLSQIEPVRRLVRKILLLSKNFPDYFIEDIALAVDEACTNIIKHSYRHSQGRIILRIKVKEKKVQLNITDFGSNGFIFNPVLFPDLQRQDLKKEFPKSGFGIFLIKKVMDKIDYLVSPGISNTLYMEKHLNKLMDKYRNYK